MRWGRAVVCTVLLAGMVGTGSGGLSGSAGGGAGPPRGPAGMVGTGSGGLSGSAGAATPTAWDPRLQPIADKVAELRNLKFDHPVTAEFLSDAAFEKKVAVDKGKLSKQDKAEIERSQGQLRAVGLIGPGVDIVDAVSSLQTSGVLAY